MTRKAQAPGLGPLDDPLADWPNDDLLLEEKSRNRIARDYPDLLKILDWRELRAAFEEHDAPANEAHRKCRRFGGAAVVCGAAGMLLAALAPVLTGAGLSGWALGLLASVLTVLGTVLGLAHWIGARHRSDWLLHRFWTERLRQFHFQFLLNHFDLAVKASAHDPALEEYKKCRTEALERLIDDFRDIRGLISKLEQDEAELSPWLQDQWPNKAPDTADSECGQLLLRALYRQRFGIQIQYTQKKRDESIHSPKTRARVVRNGCDLLTFSAMLLAGLTGVLLLFGHPLGSLAVRLSMGLGAAAGVLVLALRIVDEGLQLRVDDERYRWYLSSLRALDGRFAQSDSGGQIAALRELEHLSYKEMRRFIVAHRRARFLL